MYSGGGTRAEVDERGPFTLSDGPSSFDKLREAVESQLSAKLRNVGDAFVQQAHILHATQRLQTVVASEIATSIETAPDDPTATAKIRQDVPSLVLGGLVASSTWRARCEGLSIFARYSSFVRSANGPRIDTVYETWPTRARALWAST